jgi:hypothetical protein
MVTTMISTRIDENLLAEIDTFAAAKDKTRTEAIGTLLFAGLAAQGGISERQPGWDAKEIARIAYEYYRGLAAMFEAHDWPERGSQMLPCVQRRVLEKYGSVEKFIDFHATLKPEEFQRDLPKKQAMQSALMDPVLEPLSAKIPKQRDYMRGLVRTHGLNKEPVCAAFAEALLSGQVSWKNNTSEYSPKKYADAVWRDGEIRGWLLG